MQSFSSPRIQTLLKGLSPAYLRLGGTSADYVVYSNEPVEVFEKSGVSPTLHTYTSEYTAYCFITLSLGKVPLCSHLNARKRQPLCIKFQSRPIGYVEYFIEFFSFLLCTFDTYFSNKHKKVLLRERKRHTDCGVSSTPSVTWGGVPPGRGTPQPVLMGGTQGGVSTSPSRGTPQPGLRGVCEVEYPTRGTPQPGLRGYLRWGTPTMGTPLPARSDKAVPEVGYPLAGESPAGLGWGTPHLDLAGVPPRCGQTDGWMDGQTRVKT